jgi:hypothetical protein
MKIRDFELIKADARLVRFDLSGGPLQVSAEAFKLLDTSKTGHISPKALLALLTKLKELPSVCVSI